MNKNPLNTPTHKFCPKCKTVKPRTDYYPNVKAHDGVQGRCKVCNIEEVRQYHKRLPERHAAYNRDWDKRNPKKKKDAALKTRLGLKHGTYDSMFEAQKGKCAICEKETPGQRLHVDHCADTGQIRGLLCNNCNNGIGRFKHRIDFLIAARAYLLQHSPEGGGEGGN